VKEAELEVEVEKADAFIENFPEDTAAEYIFIRENKDDYPSEVIEAAEAWARLHLVEVAEEEEKQLNDLAEKFQSDFPYDTPAKAAEILHGLGMLVFDEEMFLKRVLGRKSGAGGDTRD